MRTQNFASVKTLVKTLHIDKESAQTIRGLVKGNIDPKYFVDVVALRKQAYHTPPRYVQIMTAINQVMRTHGIESFEHKGVEYSYANTGQTYTPTVIYNTLTKTYSVRSWGDIVESR